MQSGRGDVIYRGTWDCVRKIAVIEGPLAFFKGNLSNMYRSVSSSLVLVLNDEFKRWLFLTGQLSYAK
jgi:solute carrier family 25 (adenine nucleotide translocator) protein 4/5/6/31